MSDTTRDALHRLKRRVGKEAARCERFYANATSPSGRERAFGEANVLRMVQGFIDEEVEKLEQGAEG